MSCDIHVRTEIRTNITTADRQADLAAGLAEVSRRMETFDLVHGSPLLNTGYDYLADIGRTLAQQLSQLAGAETTRAWTLATLAFGSDCPSGPDLPANRPLLTTLTDRQLLDVAADWLRPPRPAASCAAASLGSVPFSSRPILPCSRSRRRPRRCCVAQAANQVIAATFVVGVHDPVVSHG